MKEFIDKLISRFKKVSFADIDEQYADDGQMMLFLHDAISIVNELAEEYKGGWIPCKVELPKKTGKYLACDSQGNIFITKYYEGCNGFNGNVGFVIKAWMPLPPAYTEGE